MYNERKAQEGACHLEEDETISDHYGVIANVYGTLAFTDQVHSWGFLCNHNIVANGRSD